MLLCRKLKLPVISPAHLFVDYIVYKMKNIVGDLAEKSEDRIERAHQDGKHSERFYCGLTNLQQSQIAQSKNNAIITNPKVKLKSEQIKNESKRNLKRKT